MQKERISPKESVNSNPCNKKECTAYSSPHQRNEDQIFVHDAHVCGNEQKTISPAEQEYAKAQSDIQAGKWDEGFTTLKALVRKRPDFAPAHNALASLYYHRGAKVLALMHYEKAVSLDSENFSALKDLADFYHTEMNRTEDAIQIYSRIVAGWPHDIETMLVLANLCESLERLNVAAVLYFRILSYDPTNATAQSSLDTIQRSPKESVPERSPGNQYQDASFLANAGLIDDAITTLENLLQSYPDFALAHNDLGVLLSHTGDKTKSLIHYEKAVGLEPDNTIFLRNLADFYYVVLDRQEDALLHYRRILSVNPDDVTALLVQGQIYFQLNLIQESENIYRKILTFDKNNMTSIHMLYILLSRINTDEIHYSPDWLAAYPQDGVYFLISNPQEFAHDETKYDEQHNIAEMEMKVGRGLVKLLNEKEADFTGPALEIGCGTGLLSVGLARHAAFPFIILTDPSPRFLELTLQKLVLSEVPLAPIRLAVLRGEDLERLPSNEFSLVVLRSVLHHVLDVKKFISDVARSLRPGGILTFQESCMEGYVMMGVLAQFIPIVIKESGHMLNKIQIQQIELFIKTMHFYARRDIDKSRAEDKHLFRVDELIELCSYSGLNLEFMPNMTYEAFSNDPNTHNITKRFFAFFHDYLKYLMSFDHNLMDLIDTHFSKYCTILDDLSAKSNGIYMQGVFICRKR
jgi:tetratricopeptide (TPR) repeat protein